MEIKTKYNIGDSVFFINEKGKVDNKQIDDIRIRVEKRYKLFGVSIETDIIYYINCKYVDEEKCFPTKEELLKSL